MVVLATATNPISFWLQEQYTSINNNSFISLTFQKFIHLTGRTGFVMYLWPPGAIFVIGYTYRRIHKLRHFRLNTAWYIQVYWEHRVSCSNNCTIAPLSKTRPSKILRKQCQSALNVRDDDVALPGVILLDGRDQELPNEIEGETLEQN